MTILIDYDNLGRLKEMRLINIIEQILERSPVTSSNSQVSNCRLYGGWLYRGYKLTDLASKLSAQIRRDFPQVVQVLGQKIKINRPKLATSLICDEGNHFPNTFRTRSNLPPLRLESFPFAHCVDKGQCYLSGVHSFFRRKICGHDQCSVTPDDTFYRTEQKLVDSMIVTDLVHLSMFTKEPVVLVSGDDDMWPGIRYALINHVELIHFIPKSIRRRGNPFRKLRSEHYSLKRL